MARHPLYGSARFSPRPTPLQTSVSTIISKFNVTHHPYADDTQIYLELDSRTFNSNMTELSKMPSGHPGVDRKETDIES